MTIHQTKRGRNDDLMVARQERARSNAAGAHGDRRNRRRRTRGDDRRAAIRESGGGRYA